MLLYFVVQLLVSENKFFVIDVFLTFFININHLSVISIYLFLLDGLCFIFSEVKVEVLIKLVKNLYHLLYDLIKLVNLLFSLSILVVYLNVVDFFKKHSHISVTKNILPEILLMELLKDKLSCHVLLEQ